MNNNLIYNTKDKLPFWKNLLFAMQQLLAIVAATILVPVLVDPSGIYLSQSAALIGAGIGTIVYLIFTQFKSPVFLGSSFAYIAPLITAVGFGYFGVFLGSLISGAVYLFLALIIKFVGSNWINKIMPPIIIGPVVALIGFDLSASAVNNIMNTSVSMSNYNWVSIIVGLVTFFVVVLVSVRGRKTLKMFPFIIGILFGYILAVILTLIGNATNTQILQLVDFTPFEKISNFKNWIPNLVIVGVFKEGTSLITSFGDVLTIFIAFVPIALVSFAEHIADHKNLSSIIGKDLLKDPGLTRTLLADGSGSIAGSFFGGVPNTTYGESIGCVALSKNASTRTIFTSAILCIILAFIYPVIVFIATIPGCVLGGICIALYGFISVSGLRMLSGIDLNENKNLFVVASIFICGIGGLVLNFGAFKVTSIACALIVGILTNAILSVKNKKANEISNDSSLLESKDTIIEEDKNKNKTDNGND